MATPSDPVCTSTTSPVIVFRPKRRGRHLTFTASLVVGVHVKTPVAASNMAPPGGERIQTVTRSPSSSVADTRSVTTTPAVALTTLATRRRGLEFSATMTTTSDLFYVDRLTAGFTRRFHETVSRDGFTRRFHETVSRDGFTRRFHETVSRGGLTRRFHETVSRDGFTRRFHETVS